MGIVAAALAGGLAFAPLPFAAAQDPVVATVNGKNITEADIRLAETEIGSDLGTLPEATKRRVLVEYLIENQLFAEAAEGDKLASSNDFDGRMQYWRRRALRDTYFDKSVKGAVSEADARRFYDEQVKQLKPEEEVKARHILVESEDKAKEIAEKIAHGADFAEMAKEFSKDPGTKDEGGTLGYFSRGQMVPQFEEAAFKLQKGDVSQPVQTQFGWHLIQVEDRRERQPPDFAVIKERLMVSMIHRKAQEIAASLRGKAKIEYVDAEIKKQVETEKKPGAPAPKQ
ncbi:MAG: peptidylprolyl isomerase [Hyphomicrobiaceae bacterium]|nr:peptidylprolyl isomerase [Hyphomicrobiaceae bacterium]